jgi:sulfonate transport system substrate-binding protein
MTPRRSLLLAAPALLMAGAARADSLLKMGDQRGNVRAQMEAAGVLKDLPYRLEWAEFPAAAPLAEAMAAGAVDGGVIGDAPFTFAFAAGAEIRAVAVRRSNQEGTAIVVKGDSPAQSFADLKGRTIGTGRGSIGHFLVLAALEKQGWTTSDIKLVFLLPADAKAALAAGSIDAWSTWEPYTSQMEVVDKGRRVVSGVGLTPGLGFQAATLPAIKGKREALEDFVERMTRARRWGTENADAYARVWAQLMNFPVEVPQNWFRRAAERVVEIDDSVYRDEQIVIDIYARNKLVRRRFEAVEAFDPSFNAAIRRGNAG